MAELADRTERATPRRRKAARRHGHVVLSSEVAPVATLVAALALATAGAPVVVDRARAMLASWLAAAGPTAAADGPVGPLLWRAGADLAGVLVPFFLAVAMTGVGAVVAQVGWHPNPALVVPDPTRLGLVTGARRLWSLDGLASLVRASVKIALVLALTYRVVAAWADGALAATLMPVEAILALAGTALSRLGVTMAAALAVVGAADWAWTRWRHERSLRMSRAEVREEQKQSEGDPQLRARFRRAHRDVARRRMQASVERADVVLTAPHVAVALRYRADEAAAPRVLAKGRGVLAETIRASARRAGVPVVERDTLARALDRTVEIAAEVPPALYRGVAEILAWVHERRGGSEETV